MALAEKREKFVFMNLCSMRQSEKLKIVNLVSFEGSLKNENIECYGFDKDGTPVFEKEAFTDYPFTGAFTGLVNMNIPFNKLRIVKEGKVIDVLTEFKAISYFLSVRGIPISVETCEVEIKKLMKLGIKRIFVYKESCISGMNTETYKTLCEQDDKWVFSGEKPQPDYDTLWNNNALPFLKSEWRIATDSAQRLLNRRILASMKT
jgi:hypothetical protein